MNYEGKKAIVKEVEDVLSIVQEHFLSLNFDKVMDTSYAVKNEDGVNYGTINITNICDMSNVTLKWYPAPDYALYCPRRKIIFNAMDDIKDSAQIAQWVLAIQVDLGL